MWKSKPNNAYRVGRNKAAKYHPERNIMQTPTEFANLNRRRFLKAAMGSTIGCLGAVSTAMPLWAGEEPAAKTKPDYPPARAVTSGPKHHFFGYYDKCPWNASGRYLLAMEIDFCDRQPNPGEALTVGLVDLNEGNRFMPLDTTTAWSWQQGTMLQWVGPASDREIIYNVTDGDHYAAVIRDVHSGKTRRLPCPIYAISADGKQAVTLPFDRLNRLRPGYGYMALLEKYQDDPAPAEIGIFWMDLRTGQNKLIIPIRKLAENKPDGRFTGANHWVNHLQFNPSGTRFCFIHRWAMPGKSFTTRYYTAKPDGSDIRLISDTGLFSHFDWRDDNTILGWARTKEKGNHFYLFDAVTGETEVVGDGVLTVDGHCNYSPNRKWILDDTYPDKSRLQTLILLRVADGKRFDVGKFYLPPQQTGPFRCDLHPRWNRNGAQVCIDSAHEATRQIYVIDVSEIVKA
jgi:hypothetical protein